MVVYCFQEVLRLGGIIGFPSNSIFLYGGFSYRVFPLERDFHIEVLYQT